MLFIYDYQNLVIAIVHLRRLVTLDSAYINSKDVVSDEMLFLFYFLITFFLDICFNDFTY